ncbi:hypothetical protein KBB96_02970 [Luteolibacter ambystomatis]|uniref:AAA family ATPase n=1 Tax=Luteolibacter ambystomatis TaxID=2824561 RepID=A0A975J0P0_9BACT|nr:hypothetical protein [Luteolibacter ambystomatis]QUE51860.1 hypothetical protein KBB96_02970 [Luteolibacter ambystomatis]
MRRILVTGNAGSGKTTFARRVAAELGIPCHGLDPIVWQPGWKKTPAQEKARRIAELITSDAWVIDGVSDQVQASADIVVFLDVPRWCCFLRVAKRNWRYLFRSRPELPPGCPEIRIIPTLIRIIWNFPANVRPGILSQVGQAGEGRWFFHIRTAAGKDRCLVALSEVTAALPR